MWCSNSMNEDMIKTMSLCPECYKVIPAVIQVGVDGVYMFKHCEEHGDFTGMVERDSQWYRYVKSMGNNNIYNGYMIDVTKQCNLDCYYCYHKHGCDHIPMKEVMQEAMDNRNLAPFILTGGEPTLHPDLPQIIREMRGLGVVTMLTNGTVMTDERYLDEVAHSGLLIDNTLMIGLSFHEESQGADIALLELCRKRKWKVRHALCVVDSVDQSHENQIDKYLAIFRKYRDTIIDLRIKAAGNLGNTDCVMDPMFTSDIYNYLCSKGKTMVVARLHKEQQYIKNSFVTVMHKGLLCHLVAWYNIDNVDLQDIDCPPYYRANDGNLYNFATALMINQGMEKRKRAGLHVRRADHRDVWGVRKLWADLIREKYPDPNPNEKMWVEQTHASMNQMQGYRLYIAEMGGEIVGFSDGAVVMDAAINDKYVTGKHIYVKPEYRHSMVAVQLHKEIVKDGMGQGARIFRSFANEEDLPRWIKSGYKPRERLIEIKRGEK